MKQSVEYFYKEDLMYAHRDGLGYAFAFAQKSDEEKIDNNKKRVTHWCICDRDLLYGLHKFTVHAMLDMDKKDTVKRNWLWVLVIDGEFTLTKERHTSADDVGAFYKNIFPESKIVVSARVEASEEEIIK